VNIAAQDIATSLFGKNGLNPGSFLAGLFGGKGGSAGGAGGGITDWLGSLFGSSSANTVTDQAGSTWKGFGTFGDIGAVSGVEDIASTTARTTADTALVATSTTLNIALITLAASAEAAAAALMTTAGGSAASGLAGLGGNAAGAAAASAGGWTGFGDFYPGFAEGTNYVSRTGLALIHQGEAVVPKKYNTGSGRANSLHIVVNVPSNTTTAVAEHVAARTGMAVQRALRRNA
jgi:hypothetical protein